MTTTDRLIAERAFDASRAEVSRLTTLRGQGLCDAGRLIRAERRLHAAWCAYTEEKQRNWPREWQ